MQLTDIIKEFENLFKENYSDLKYLVSNVKGMEPSKLFVNNCNLSEKEEKKLLHYIAEYQQGKPIDKITNESNFYGYKFFIDANVLSPRRDTEIMIDAVHDIKNTKDKFNILDLCTGSGVILITLLLEFTNSFGTGIDISNDAILISKKNAGIHKVNNRCNFLKNDILKDINLYKKDKYDVIVSNPPYIKSKDIKTLDESVKRYDPIIALDGGEQGTVFYKKILENVKPFINNNGVILFEIGYDIESEVKELIKLGGFYLINEYKDIQNITRILALKMCV